MFKEIIMNPKPQSKIQASPTYIDDPYFYQHPEKPVQEHPHQGWKILHEGTTKGRLLGGHIGSLLTLAGTEYWPNLQGVILFLEEDEIGTPKKLRRMFKQLDHMRVFEEINGLLLGRIPQVTGVTGNLNMGSLIEDIIEGYNFPVVLGMDFGHTNPIMTIPVGIKAEISTSKSMLTYLEPGVR